MLLAIFAFVCGSLLVAAAAKALSPRSATIVDRLEEIVGVQARAPEESRFTKTASNDQNLRRLMRNGEQF